MNEVVKLKTVKNKANHIHTNYSSVSNCHFNHSHNSIRVKIHIKIEK